MSIILAAVCPFSATKSSDTIFILIHDHKRLVQRFFFNDVQQSFQHVMDLFDILRTHLCHNDAFVSFRGIMPDVAEIHVNGK